MANNLFYTYHHPTGPNEAQEIFNDGTIPSSILGSYYDSIIFDRGRRMIWHEGWPFGHSYWGSTYGEIFNDFNNNQAGNYAHAEGSQTFAFGDNSHTEGENTYAFGIGSHAEGLHTYAGNYESEDSQDIVGNYSHAEGVDTIAFGIGSHVEGFQSQTLGDYSHAEGENTFAIGEGSHTEGYETYAIGTYSHAEGSYSQAGGDYSHAEGYLSYTMYWTEELEYTYGIYAHAEGYNTYAYGEASHAEGQYSVAEGFYAHAEGYNTYAAYLNSHAEGQNTCAYNTNAHAEGQFTIASGKSSHSEGSSTYATGDYSHAEGTSTVAFGEASHAEGSSTYATGNYSHAGGINSSINGNYAFGHGSGLKTINNGEVAFGTYNNSRNSDGFITYFSIGDGTDANRSNAFEIVNRGNTSPTQYVSYLGNRQLIDNVRSTEATNNEDVHIWVGTQAEWEELIEVDEKTHLIKGLKEGKKYENTLFFIEDYDEEKQLTDTVNTINDLKNKVEKLEALLNRAILKSDQGQGEGYTYIWAGNHSNYEGITDKNSDTIYLTINN